MIRNIAKVLVVVILLLIVVGGSILAGDKVIKIGATPVPHGEILKDVVQPLLAEEGIELEIVEFTDYITPNLALADGSIDANYFQHVPYLEQFSNDHNLDLISVAKVHIEPFGLYSDKLKSIDELPEGATIAVPNDPSNEGRALLLLASQGIITLPGDDVLDATPIDIVKNPKKLKFKELEAAQLPRILPDVTAAFINTNYALEAGLNPLEDALIIEGDKSPYANILVVRGGDQDNELIQELVDALTSDEVEEYILDKYEGAVVPVF